MIAGGGKRVSWYTGAALFFCALGYGLFQAHALLAGPSLLVAAPKNGAVVNMAFVEVSGHANRATTLSMNGRPVLTHEDGSFSEPLLLAEGYNRIPLLARDRFGAEKEVLLEIVYEVPAATTAFGDEVHLVKR